MLPVRTPEDIKPTNPFIFPTGTVKLLATYKGQSIVGSVSADALVLASPVWKKFLFPPWMDNSEQEQARDVKQREVDCTEDDGEALLILLNIAHLNFGDVPANLKYSTLLGIAVLIDQYDCIKIVRPWLESWMKNEKEESLKANQDGWLFISWVFGRETTFSALARHMKVILVPGNLIAEPMPPGIIASIVECRKQALNQMLIVPYSRLDTLERAMRSSTPACSVGGRESKVCDAAQYGSIIFGLTIGSISLYPRRGPELLECSVSSVADLLSKIQLHHIKPEPVTVTPADYGDEFFTARLAQSLYKTGRSHKKSRGRHGLGWATNDYDEFGQSEVESKDQDLREQQPNPRDHSRCAISVSASVARILDDIQNPMLDSHRVHMRLQRGEAVMPIA